MRAPPRALIIPLALALTACAERRTAGLECLSDRDCAADQRCDVTRSICAPTAALFAPCPLVKPDGQWPQVVVLANEARSPRTDRALEITTRAVDSMGDRAPRIALCTTGRHVESLLSAWPAAAPPVIIGPLEDAAGGPVRRVAGALDALALPLRATAGDAWALGPAPTALAPIAAAGLAAVGDPGPIIIVQPPGSPTRDAFADAWCPAQPDCAVAAEPLTPRDRNTWFDPKGDPEDNPLWGAGLVLVDARDGFTARLVVQAAVSLEPRPAVLVLGGYPDGVTYRPLLSAGPEGEAIDPDGLCAVRALTTLAPGPVDIHPPDRLTTREDGQDARIHDGVMLAGLLMLANGDRLPTTAAALAPRLRTLLVGAGDPIVLDADGWARAADRAAAGAALPPLRGAAAVSIPAHDTGHPPIVRASLRRLGWRRPMATPIPEVIDRAEVITDGAFDPQAFTRAWSGGDCRPPD